VQPSIVFGASIALSDVLFQAVWHHPLPCLRSREVFSSGWTHSPTSSRYGARGHHFSTGWVSFKAAYNLQHPQVPAGRPARAATFRLIVAKGPSSSAAGASWP